MIVILRSDSDEESIDPSAPTGPQDDINVRFFPFPFAPLRVRVRMTY